MIELLKATQTARVRRASLPVNGPSVYGAPGAVGLATVGHGTITHWHFKLG